MRVDAKAGVNAPAVGADDDAVGGADMTGAARLLALRQKQSETEQTASSRDIDSNEEAAHEAREVALREQAEARKAAEKSGLFGKWSGTLEVVAFAATAASAVATGGATAVVAGAALAAKGAAEIAKREGASSKLVTGLDIASSVGMGVAGGVGAFSGAASIGTLATSASRGFAAVGSVASGGAAITTGISQRYAADAIDDRADATASLSGVGESNANGDRDIERMRAEQTHENQVERTLRSTLDQARSARLSLIRNVGKG